MPSHNDGGPRDPDTQDWWAIMIFCLPLFLFIAYVVSGGPA